MGQFKKIDELNKEIARYVIEFGRLGGEILSLRREGYPDYHKNLKTRLHNYYKVNGIIKKLEKEKMELMNKYLHDNDATKNMTKEIGQNHTIEKQELEENPIQAQDSKFRVLYYTGRDLLSSELKEEVLLAENSEKVKEILRKKDPDIWRWVEIRQVHDEGPKAELIKYAEATKDPDYIKYVKEMKNQANINARLQWHRQKETKDRYNLEDPKKIQEVINKLEKDLREGKYVNISYLAGLKRALEMAKGERNMKDSFDMLKLCGIV